jgi:TonB family protein
MRFRIILLALIYALAQTPPLHAKDAKWFEVASEHFLLFTDTSEMKGRRLVSDFENRVDAFSQVFGKVPARPFPIEIFLLKEEQDFNEALPRVKAEQDNTPRVLNGIPTAPPLQPERKIAYLFRGPDRMFIVARDKSPDDIANDVGHALGHALIERFGIWRPFWLAEGAAEYVRKIGRAADLKAIPDDDRFTAADMFSIVPSDTYNDSDPPTLFRTESYRLVRLLLAQKPEVLRQYLQALHVESDKPPKIPIDADSLDALLKAYVEMPLKAAAGAPAVQSIEADPARLAVHHGDLLLSTDRNADAERLYKGETKDARAARAIITRFTRPPAEAIRVLDRASRELPENVLVQYHFGVMDVKDKKDLQSQIAALERAVKGAPLMGRAFAELARVYALNGQAEKSLPLVAKALDLEPEHADHFFEVRSDAYTALGDFPKALHDINLATDLPHGDRATVERFLVKVTGVRKRIESVKRAANSRELEDLRKEVRAEAEEREPPPLPSPPPPPVPEGGIRYDIETRAPLEVVDVVYPDYPEALRKKGAAGKITLQVDIGPDGKVKTATIANSQLQDLDKATLEAVKKWSFKPGNRNIRLILTFSLQ